MKKIIHILTAFSFLLATTQAGAAAVNFNPEKEVVPIASEYMFKNLPDESLLTVQVLGGVNKPGIYHIPSGTDVVTLVSLTGGVYENADLDDVILRKNKQKKIEHINLNEIVSRIETQPTPLDHGDVIFVDLKKPLIDTNTVTLITVTSIILGSILTAITIRDNN